MSASGDPLDKLSWFLERIITQLLVFVPAHLQNTYDYLDRLHTKFPQGFPPGSIAFSVDVANLYGNIPTSEAISFVLDLIKRHTDKINLFGLTLNDVKTLLEHCLNNNYLRFGKHYFKHTTGIAMGSRIATPLAIVFMNAGFVSFYISLKKENDKEAQYVFVLNKLKPLSQKQDRFSPSAS